MDTKKEDLTKTLEATVMSKTLYVIQQMAQASQLSVGEVIDRLTLRLQATEINAAVLFAMDQIQILFSALSDDQLSEAFIQLVISIATFFPLDILETLPERVLEERLDYLRSLDTDNPEHKEAKIEIERILKKLNKQNMLQ